MTQEKMIGIWLPVEIHKEFKRIANRDGFTLKEQGKRLFEKHIKEHGDGNDQFTIDQFQDPNFHARPAFDRNEAEWITYLNATNEQVAKEIENQALMISAHASKKIQYGDAMHIVVG